MEINRPSHLFSEQIFCCLDCQLLIFMDCIAHLCFYLYPGLPNFESFIKAGAGKIKAILMGIAMGINIRGLLCIEGRDRNYWLK